MYKIPNYNLNAGDEVIVPAVSWSTTFLLVQQNGLVLKFVDIDKNTLNIDPKLVEQAITEKTKAVLAVNLLGNSCELAELKRICDDRGLVLIEDNCESFGASPKTNTVLLGAQQELLVFFLSPFANNGRWHDCYR